MLSDSRRVNEVAILLILGKFHSMQIFDTNNLIEIIKLLNDGKIGVLPTDTIYGLHCSIFREASVQKIYELKGKDKNMPFITLISDQSELNKFNLILGDLEAELCKKYWPGPNTIIFQTKSGETRSFRVPDNSFLQSVLKQTGPLLSTSANTHGGMFSKDIKEATLYFGDNVDFYVDAGLLNNPPSSIYKIEGSSVHKIR
jgi:tRNA threonylcarbamoyl adenosine modification protein (Sua5/YciO/YrdC/YwlC family)